MKRATTRDLVVIGASAGGVAPLKSLLRDLPDTDATYLIVVHRLPTAKSRLDHVLARHSKVEVREPSGGEALRPRTAYLAPTDRHMRVIYDTVEIDHGPKQHHTRPAIDPLFTSAAQSYGARTIGILLSGNLSDGVAGLVAIKQNGGLSLVQDPQEAEWPSMPESALRYDHVDLVFQMRRLPALLERLIDGASVEEAAAFAGVELVKKR